MRTMHCSSCLSCHACPHHAHPSSAMHAPSAMHTPCHAWQVACMPPIHSPPHTLPCHACPLPCMPPTTHALPATHGPHLLHMSACHSCPLPCLPLFATYAPLSPCMPPPCMLTMHISSHTCSLTMPPARHTPHHACPLPCMLPTTLASLSPCMPPPLPCMPPSPCMPPWTDRCLWQHYLSETTVVDGKDNN